MPMKGWGNGKVFTPAIDIKEKEDKLVVTIYLLGINKEDIKIKHKTDTNTWKYLKVLSCQNYVLPKLFASSP